ncbi:MAG: hypothetical protein HUU02_02730 [Bacteroidetes bacterium]|nr:hypothetical protein [Bacteroidota bacterium]
MAQIAFRGESGKKYSFAIHPITTLFRQEAAVYVITRRTTDAMNKVSHKHIFVGETDNLGKQFDGVKDHLLARYDANCICVHFEEDKKKRLNIESDLVGNYNPPGNE